MRRHGERIRNVQGANVNPLERNGKSTAHHVVAQLAHMTRLEAITLCQVSASAAAAPMQLWTTLTRLTSLELYVRSRAALYGYMPQKCARGEVMVLNILATPIAALTRLRRLYIAGAAHELYHSSDDVDVDYDVSAAGWAPMLDKLTALTELCLAGIGGGFAAAATLGPSIAKLPCLRKLEVRSSVWFYSELGPLYQAATNEFASFNLSLSALRFCDTNLGSEAWTALRNALPSLAALRSLRLTQELQRPGQRFSDTAPDEDPEAFPALISEGIAAITALTELELTRTRARNIVDALPALGTALAHLHCLQRLTFAQSSSMDGAHEPGAVASEQNMLPLAACIFTPTELTALELGIPTAVTGDRCPGAQAVLRS